jgi:hypothetical protein
MEIKEANILYLEKDLDFLDVRHLDPFFSDNSGI